MEFLLTLSSSWNNVNNVSLVLIMAIMRQTGLCCFSPLELWSRADGKHTLLRCSEDQKPWQKKSVTMGKQIRLKGCSMQVFPIVRASRVSVCVCKRETTESKTRGEKHTTDQVVTFCIVFLYCKVLFNL